MSRYQSIPIVKTESNPKRRYTVTRYPSIPRSNSDLYVYVTRGDRYDLLAFSSYGNPSLWWIVALANTNSTIPDSLFPNPGDQIRIPSPSNVSSIVATYEALNRNNSLGVI
jgi:hypothetical protein